MRESIWNSARRGSSRPAIPAKSLRTKQESVIVILLPERTIPAVTVAAAYLETLNPEQRRAVEHGVREQDCTPGAPLLVIAGAGSGKTNTLAHRVAHLIVNGADPRRILLMTFSRRAAAEMTRRVERIARRVMGQRADIMTDALAWAGTFHGIGARLLRDYADQIGLDPNFTIHDREDSADLMNLVGMTSASQRPRAGFPTKGTCLAIYSRAVNSEAPLDEVLRSNFPWCADWEESSCASCSRPMSRPSRRTNVLDYDDLLLYWAQAVSDPLLADDIGGRLDHVLVDEYQDTNRLQSSILLALKPGRPRSDRCRRRRPVDLFAFARRPCATSSTFPSAFSPSADIITLDRNYRSTQPILAAANGVIDLAGERFTKNLWTERAFGARRPQLVTVRDETDQARYIVEQVLNNREVGTTLKAASGAVPHLQPQRPAGSRADAPQYSLREVRRPQVPRQRARQGHAGPAAVRAEPARPRRRAFASCSSFPASDRHRRSAYSTRMAEEPDPLAALVRAFPAPPRSGDDWSGFVGTSRPIARRPAGWPAEIELGATLVRAASRPDPRRRQRCAWPTCCNWSRSPSGYPSRERFLTELTLDPPDATSDQAGVPLLG